MHTALETSQGIQYKLRMMEANLDIPAYIYGDNMSVVHNTSKPESTLKKKANLVCYHYIRKVVAADECRTGHISTHENPADIATKPLPSGDKKDYLVSKMTVFSHQNTIQELEVLMFKLVRRKSLFLYRLSFNFTLETQSIEYPFIHYYHCSFIFLLLLL